MWRRAGVVLGKCSICLLSLFVALVLVSGTHIQVRWVQQQHEKIRRKRDYSSLQPEFGAAPAPQHLLYARQYDGLLRAVAPQSRLQYRDTGGAHSIFPDPLFKEQWYLVSRVCVDVLFCVFFLIFFLVFD